MYSCSKLYLAFPFKWPWIKAYSRTTFLTAFPSRGRLSRGTFAFTASIWLFVPLQNNEKKKKQKQKTKNKADKQYCIYDSATLFSFYENAVYPAQAEYSYLSADFRLKGFMFLYYSETIIM